MILASIYLTSLWRCESTFQSTGASIINGFAELDRLSSKGTCASTVDASSQSTSHDIQDLVIVGRSVCVISRLQESLPSCQLEVHVFRFEKLGVGKSSSLGENFAHRHEGTGNITPSITPERVVKRYWC